MEGRIKDHSRNKRGGRYGDRERCREWFLKVGQAGDPQAGTVSPATLLPSLTIANPSTPKASLAMAVMAAAKA